jgi:hypothetical protein
MDRCEGYRSAGLQFELYRFVTFKFSDVYREAVPSASQPEYYPYELVDSAGSIDVHWGGTTARVQSVKKTEDTVTVITM